MLSILKGNNNPLSQKSNARGWSKQWRQSPPNLHAETLCETMFLLQILLLVMARDLYNSSSGPLSLGFFDVEVGGLVSSSASISFISPMDVISSTLPLVGELVFQSAQLYQSQSHSCMQN